MCLCWSRLSWMFKVCAEYYDKPFHHIAMITYMFATKVHTM